MGKGRYQMKPGTTWYRSYITGYENSPEILDWCASRCREDYANTFLLGLGETEWAFKNRKDAILFKLTWVQ